MIHAWTILCQIAIRNPETRNTSLIEILDQVRVNFGEDQMPQAEVLGIPFQGSVVTKWLRSDLEKPEEARIRLRVFDPKGADLTADDKNEILINLTESKAFVATIRFNTLPITISGIYRFRIQALEDNVWREAASVPLEITIQRESNSVMGS